MLIYMIYLYMRICSDKLRKVTRTITSDSFSIRVRNCMARNADEGKVTSLANLHSLSRELVT